MKEIVFISIILGVFLLPLISFAFDSNKIYYYTLKDDGTARSYDEVIAVNTIQGIVNKSNPVLWVNAENEKFANFWQKKLSEDNRWLADREWVKIENLDDLVELFKDKMEGIVVWDTDVSATLNVGTTISGVENLILLSPDFAAEYAEKWKLAIKVDLRGKFDGSETGSKKNDAYRWAIREYLAKGKCSDKFIFLYDDPWKDKRETGALRYSTGRDWIVYNKGFVFDVSPWGDEISPDDPNQKLGTDRETYKLILQTVYDNANGEYMTELSGFFDFFKYSIHAGGKHGEIETEWESVHLMTPYNVFQNTADHNCYNRSFHKNFDLKPLKQTADKEIKSSLENKTYICILMADYDSATPLYAFLPPLWEDEKRGEIPLSWAINPNLIDSYPDVISYYYETATANDYFVSDAGAAGYFNPTLIKPEHLTMFTNHNKRYFELADMDIAPMILDIKPLTNQVKDSFLSFAKSGIGVTLSNDRCYTIQPIEPEVWKGMTMTNLVGAPDSLIKNPYFENNDFAKFANWINATYLKELDKNRPNFFYMRIIWSSPSQIIGGFDAVKNLRSDLGIEIVDPYTFFNLLGQSLEKKQ